MHIYKDADMHALTYIYMHITHIHTQYIIFPFTVLSHESPSCIVLSLLSNVHMYVSECKETQESYKTSGT